MAFKYGQIAESQAVNAFIYRCFEDLPEGERRKFVKSFRQQPHDQPQVMHTFRELILGAYLCANGFQARYGVRVQGQTPDWVILDNQATPLAMVELVNFHIDRRTESEIKQRNKSRPAIVTYWRDENADNSRRLCERL